MLKVTTPSRLTAVVHGLQLYNDTKFIKNSLEA